MPALIRLALVEPKKGEGWYAEQLLFHLYSGFRENAFYRYCSPRQRAAIAAYLAHLIETRSEYLASDLFTDHLLRAHELWFEAAR